MKRSYSFRSRTVCLATHVLVDVLTVFFARPPADITVLTDDIQDALKTDDPIPDVLYVFGSSAVIGRTAELWLAHQAQIAVLLERGNPPGLSAIKENALIEFHHGTFVRRPILSSPQLFQVAIEELLRDGLAQAVSVNRVYQLAPSGHVFKHPSGRHSKQFFLASELLRNDIDVYFVAMCVCVEAWASLNRATRVFIDTMGIYPIARAVHELLVGAGRAAELQWDVENYHSHEGLNDLQFGILESDVALISASTSGGLANTLHKDKSFKPRNIITLLDVHRAGRVGWVVHANSDFAEANAQLGRLPVDPHETPIELVGEYFAARGKRPRALTLATTHAPTELKKVLDCFFRAGDSAINRQRKGGVGVDVISLTDSVISKSSEFGAWVAEEVRLKTPVSATHVIAADKLESMAVAKLVSDALTSAQSRPSTVIVNSELESLRGQPVGGVVVCASLVGNGHSLRLISRDLREICPQASRHFIVGLGLPDSYESWQRLRQFLGQSGNALRPYQVSSWRHMALGRRRPNDCWTKFAILMQELEHIAPDALEGCSAQIVATSLTAASALLEQRAAGFLPNTAGSELVLTEGFVYWQPDKASLAGASHGPISYLAVTAVLQHAREFEDPARRLRSTLYETVVLDPENFLRFNDGVLQASLLRAAYTSELDYSMTIDGSQGMREILEKILLNHARRYGEAALEFAAALAAGHLRLARPDATELFASVRQLLSTATPLAGLLYFWWHQYVRRPE